MKERKMIKNIFLCFIFCISKIYAGSFIISTYSSQNYSDETLIKTENVYKTTNFQAIYSFNYFSNNALSVSLNNNYFTTPQMNVNKVQINLTETYVNVFIYYLNGAIMQSKALNQFTYWGDESSMLFSIIPICNESSDMSCQNNSIYIKIEKNN